MCTAYICLQCQNRPTVLGYGMDFSNGTTQGSRHRAWRNAVEKNRTADCDVYCILSR